MKTLLFSDTHLTNHFNKKQFLFLKKIINSADRVIIVGDFWEGRLITFDEFLNSEWNILFPLLKKKHTVYIYGNHDRENMSDKRVKLFSDIQTNKYEVTIGQNNFIIEHGDTFNIKFYYLSNLAKKSKTFDKFFMKHVHNNAEALLVKLFGKHAVQILFRRYNKKIKKSVKKRFKKNEIFICGHTHAGEIDLKNQFVNTGFIRHGIGQYATIDSDSIKLHTEKYN